MKNLYFEAIDYTNQYKVNSESLDLTLKPNL